MSEGHKEICKIFASGNYCKFEKRCRYLHFRPPKLTNQSNSYKEENEAVNYQQKSTSGYKPENETYSRISQYEALAPRFCVNTDLKIKSQDSGSWNQPNYDLSRSYECKNIHYEADVNVQQPVKNVCRFYEQFKRCNYGDQCKFAHVDVEPVVGDSSSGVNEVKSHEQNSSICKFFTQGFCRYGHNCRFSHSKASNEEGNRVKLKDINSHLNYVPEANLKDTCKDSGSKKEDGVCAVVKSVRSSVPQNFYNIKEINDEVQKQIRDSEIVAFKKRYPRFELVTVNKRERFKFCFNPTDPDWPYDVKEVVLNISFPENYPLEPFSITLSENEMLPYTVKRYIWKSIEDWVNQRHEQFLKENKAELMFRPFVRWFDKAAEDIFTAGLKLYQKELVAKSAGIELVPASELKEKFQQVSLDSEDSIEEYQSPNDDESDYDSSEDEENETEIPIPKSSANESCSLDPTKRGIEVKLHNLLLKENTSSLMIKKVHLIIQCGRCKNREEIVSSTERINSLNCTKCFTKQLVNFRASLAHQFSNIVGYIDAEGCTVFDIILAECDFIVGCLKCSNNAQFGNLPPGKPKDTWCHNCHAKLSVAADCAKLLQLQASTLQGAKNIHIVDSKKAKRPPKDPAIQEGKPLPDNGTCKHYKKSFKWLRFPCCGKAYACDVCHDDREDHECDFAPRMICGYCCKEQPFAADRPCKACNIYLNKKFTEHWEGGKGCRDKIRMSTGDRKKYSNQNKTISKKAQAKQTTNAKKNVKIRHS